MYGASTRVYRPSLSAREDAPAAAALSMFGLSGGRARGRFGAATAIEGEHASTPRHAHVFEAAERTLSLASCFMDGKNSPRGLAATERQADLHRCGSGADTARIGLCADIGEEAAQLKSSQLNSSDLNSKSSHRLKHAGHNRRVAQRRPKRGLPGFFCRKSFSGP